MTVTVIRGVNGSLSRVNNQVKKCLLLAFPPMRKSCPRKTLFPEGVGGGCRAPIPPLPCAGNATGWRLSAPLWTRTTGCGKLLNYPTTGDALICASNVSSTHWRNSSQQIVQMEAMQSRAPTMARRHCHPRRPTEKAPPKSVCPLPPTTRARCRLYSTVLDSQWCSYSTGRRCGS